MGSPQDEGNQSHRSRRGVVTEMLSALSDTGVNVLHTLANKIYDSKEIPNDMLKSVCIALPKKPNTLECDQPRTISLMSHTLKLLLKVVLEQCRSKIRPEIAASIRLHDKQGSEKCHLHTEDT